MKNLSVFILVFVILVIGDMRIAHAGQFDIAVLQGLDKVTARVSTFKAAIDETINFGTLKITVRICNKRPPEETPESAAFVEIFEKRPGESPVGVYSGWMFASSPALAAMEHPVYDVWVIDCINKKIDLLPK
jgi:hypothetical protein